MRKFIGTTEIEPPAMGILQITPRFGFEALRYSDLTYIKILVGFCSIAGRLYGPLSLRARNPGTV